MSKQSLTIPNLIFLAKQFCEQESKTPNSELFGVTDGKAVGTCIEHKFKDFLLSKYELQVGSSANDRTDFEKSAQDWVFDRFLCFDKTITV
ncbi:hypothetical protein FACS1894178_4310 [Bacteroidia bacterium]|nr:hypothetical protein FACS1894178_4310 [Bacteroidia bacterium]